MQYFTSFVFLVTKKTMLKDMGNVPELCTCGCADVCSDLEL